MRWEVHGQRPVYRSEWVELWLDDVELPDGRRLEHHVLRFPRSSNTAVVIDGDRVLMIWRHRFITDSWGWEVPAGWSDPGEDPAGTIRREVEEETGYRVVGVREMTSYHALSGVSTMRFTAWLATDAERIGDPSDEAEATRVEWIPLGDIPKLMHDGQIVDGPTITALAYYLGVHNAGPR